MTKQGGGGGGGVTCRLHNWSIGHFLPHRHLPTHIDGNRCVDGNGDEREGGCQQSNA